MHFHAAFVTCPHHGHTRDASLILRADVADTGDAPCRGVPCLGGHVANGHGRACAGGVVHDVLHICRAVAELHQGAGRCD